MSFAAERIRRSTAGKRMGALVGKAQEDDEAFWGHDTWADDPDDSGNESFRSSDQDSDAKVDQFDSDFNDSETDEDGSEEDEDGNKTSKYDDEEDKRLRREELQQQKKKKAGMGGVYAAGRDLMKKKGIKGGKRRLMGDGLNAGIVLNFPGAVPAATTAAATIGSVTTALSVQPLPPQPGTTTTNSADISFTQPVTASMQAVPPPPPPSKSSPKSKQPTSRGRTTRSQQPRGRQVRASTHIAAEESRAAAKKAKAVSAASSAAVTSKKKGKRLYTQEELLLEAVNSTEPENERWILSRKRVLDLAEQDKERQALWLQQQQSGSRLVVRRFHSRRGYLNTINFPAMEFVPEILTKQQQKKPHQQQGEQQQECVITGKKARYRDPVTKLRYHDLPALKELRRRHKAGEPLDQRIKKEAAPTTTSTKTKSSPKNTFKKKSPTKAASTENADEKIHINDTAGIDKPVTVTSFKPSTSKTSTPVKRKRPATSKKSAASATSETATSDPAAKQAAGTNSSLPSATVAPKIETAAPKLEDPGQPPVEKPQEAQPPTKKAKTTKIAATNSKGTSKITKAKQPTRSPKKMSGATAKNSPSPPKPGVATVAPPPAASTKAAQPKATPSPSSSQQYPAPYGYSPSSTSSTPATAAAAASASYAGYMAAYPPNAAGYYHPMFPPPYYGHPGGMWPYHYAMPTAATSVAPYSAATATASGSAVEPVGTATAPAQPAANIPSIRGAAQPQQQAATSTTAATAPDPPASTTLAAAPIHPVDPPVSTTIDPAPTPATTATAESSQRKSPRRRKPTTRAAKVTTEDKS